MTQREKGILNKWEYEGCTRRIGADVKHDAFTLLTFCCSQIGTCAAASSSGVVRWLDSAAVEDCGFDSSKENRLMAALDDTLPRVAMPVIMIGM